METQHTAEELEFERQEREEQQREKALREGKELMNLIGNYVNYGKSRKGFIEAFKCEHRTLQQSAFKMFLELMEEMATENYRTDGRNENSKEVAKALIKGFRMVKKQGYLDEGVSEQRAEDYVTGNGARPSAYLPFV
jgi:hypothetical protein